MSKLDENEVVFLERGNTADYKAREGETVEKVLVVDLNGEKVEIGYRIKNYKYKLGSDLIGGIIDCLYHKRLSVIETSEELGVSRMMIYKYINKFNLKVMKGN